MIAKNRVLSHVESFVDAIARQSSFLKFTKLVAQEAADNPKMQEALLELHECRQDRARLTTEAEKIHDRTTQYWRSPASSDIPPAVATLLAASYLRAQRALAAQPELMSTEGLLDRVRTASSAFQKMMDNEPTFVDDLLLEIDVRAMRDRSFEQTLSDGWIELEAMSVDLQRAGEALSQAQQPIKCSVNGAPLDLWVCVAVIIIIIVIAK